MFKPETKMFRWTTMTESANQGERLKVPSISRPPANTHELTYTRTHPQHRAAVSPNGMLSCPLAPCLGAFAGINACMLQNLKLGQISAQMLTHTLYPKNPVQLSHQKRRAPERPRALLGGKTPALEKHAYSSKEPLTASFLPYFKEIRTA